MFDKIKGVVQNPAFQTAVVNTAVTIGTIIIVNVVARVVTTAILNAISGDSQDMLSEE